MQEEISRFLNRFYYFDDSVIRNIFIQFGHKVTLTLSTKDAEEPLNNGWVNVILEINDVTEFSFQESSKESYQVLSNNLHITFSNGLYFLDFGYFIDKPKDLPEYKKSKFYLVGKTLSWKVTDYQE